MIPKTIHYCWFGRNPKPKLAEKCIKSWKKYCPDYALIEWNEDNYDLNSAPLYVRQAYDAQKWAYVSDYVRLQVVYEYGGIYMDTDVELIKPLDSLLQYRAYFGFEDENYVATGLGFGAEKGHPVVKEMLSSYDGCAFILPDGLLDEIPCPRRNTEALKKWGLVLGNQDQILKESIRILPKDWLCPMHYYTGDLQKTPQTVSIHWYGGSWMEEKLWNEIAEERRKYRVEKCKEKIRSLLGSRFYFWIKQLLGRGDKDG